MKDRVQQPRQNEPIELVFVDGYTLNWDFGHVTLFPDSGENSSQVIAASLDTAYSVSLWPLS